MHVSKFCYKYKVSITVIHFILLFFILLGVYGCNSEDIFSDDVVKNKNIKELLSIQILPIKNLSLGVSDLQIAKGSYQAFVAIGFYSDDSSENISNQVFWSSTFSEIATITEIGIAKGVDVGITSIKAIKDGIISNELSLVVTAAALESIQITPAVVSLAKGNSQQYTAMGFYSDETSRELTQEVSWRSRDTSIATISEAGLVVGVGVGNSTITAVKDGVVSNDGRLTVTAAALESIQITPAVVSFAKGNSQQYTATGFYSDETSRELTQEVSWRSRDTSIATISEAGLVVGVGVGNSTITAVKDGVMSNDGRLTIAVEDANFYLNVTPKNTFIPFIGGKQQFKAELVYSDGRIEDVTSSVIWKSSSTDVAVIDKTGLATSISLLENATRIQAILKSNTSIWAETLLHVSKSRPISISINIVDGTQVLNVGEQQKYILIGIFDIAGGGFFDLSYSAKWRSSDTSVIKMIGPVAHAVGSGKATITVRYQDERENILELTVR